MHFASNLRAGRLLARGMCMGCCRPEAPEHERFGRPPVPCIKGGFVARDVGPQLVGSGHSPRRAIHLTSRRMNSRIVKPAEVRKAKGRGEP